jgi:hypothetical protein
MNGYWDLLIRPALEAAGARELVEIGSEGGKHTRRLLDWCRDRGARLHVIEPEPGYDAEALCAAYPQALVFHQSTSLEILPKLGRLDAALIDGDHNWYTVHHELLELAKANGDAFPLTFLHDMEWPFARRDMYYAPARIPGEYRQEYLKAGAKRGQSDLVLGDGIAPELYKATHEGGPRNGVRTAVEDFMAQSALALRLEIVPVDFGLGLLAPQALLASRPELAAIFDGLTAPAFEHRLLLHMETRRTDDMINMQRVYEQTKLELAIVIDNLGKHQAELRRHEVEVARLREMLEASHVEGRALRGQLDALAQQLADVPATAAEIERLRTHVSGLESQLDSVYRSRSWRLTAPLRRVLGRGGQGA